MNITSTFFHGLRELVDRNLPNRFVQKREISAPVDEFEAPPYLSAETAKAAIDSAEENLARVRTLIKATLAPMDPQKAVANRARHVDIEVRDAKRELDALGEKLELGEPVSGAALLALRRTLLESEISARKLQTEHIAESLLVCSPVRAKIEVLSVLQAIASGDQEFVVKTLKAQPLCNARRPALTDYDLLRRFDSHLLNHFAEVGLVFSMEHDLFKSIQEDYEIELPELEEARERARQQVDKLDEEMTAHTCTHEEQRDLDLLQAVKESACLNIGHQIEMLKDEERELRDAYYLRNNYYFIEPKHRRLFEHFSVLLDEAGISIASMRQSGFTLIESLFKGHFETFCSYGVIERLSSAELSAKALQKLCDVRDYLKFGNSYCRFSPVGLEQLKEALKLKPRKVPAKPKPEPKPRENLQEYKAPPAPLPERFRDYAIVKLDDSVEFY